MPSIQRQSIEMLKHKKNKRKFKDFISKVTEIGNKFEKLQKCTKQSRSEICHKIETIQSKQREFGKKLLISKDKSELSDLKSEWEKSHFHLGKAQQRNIDLLRCQTTKFEEIAQRIKSVLAQTDDPKYLSRVSLYLPNKPKIWK